MWIFKAPTDYSEMRNKISTSVFWITLIETFTLTQVSSDFSKIMELLSFGTKFSIEGVELNIALLYLPFVISVIENIFKIHDVIGKSVNLRNKYTGSIIFYQYLKEFGIDKARKECKRMYLSNEKLRKTTYEHFYYHASSTNPLIDKHNIFMALDAWCWVWILVDNIAISIIFLIGSFLYYVFAHGSRELSLGLLICIIILILLTFFTLRIECAKYSVKEVKDSIKYDNEMGEGVKNKKFKEEIDNALQCK